MRIYLSSIFHKRLDELETPAQLERNLRRADDFIRLAVVAAHETLRGEKTDIPESYGLIMGTAFGTMQTNFDVLDSVVTPEPTSPTLFSHSVFNAAGGYVASILDLQGRVLTITDFSLPFFKSLQEAYLSLLSGQIQNCLVIQVETYSQLLEDAREKNNSKSSWHPGVICWSLQSKKSQSKQYYFDGVEIQDKEHGTLSCLQVHDTVGVNDKKRDVFDPLGAALAVSEELLSEKKEKVVKIKGQLSDIFLHFKMEG